MRSAIACLVLLLSLTVWAANPDYTKDDYAERLGIQATDLLDPATAEDVVKEAMRKAVRLFHPVRNPAAPEGSFARVHEAGRYLKEPSSRRAYLISKGLVEKSAFETDPEFLLSQIAVAFGRLNRRLEEQIRLADMEALQNGQAEDRATFLEKALSRLIESYGRPENHDSRPNRSFVPSATSEFEHYVFGQAFALFWEDEMNLLLDLYDYHPDRVIQLCRKLHGVPIYSQRDGMVSYAYLSGMKHTRRLDYFDLHYEQWMSTSIWGYHENDAAKITQMVELRERRFASHASARDFFKGKVDSTFNEIKHELIFLGGRDVEAAVSWLRISTLRAAQKLEMYLKILESRDPKAAVEFSIAALDRVLPTHPEGLVQIAKDGAARIQRRLNHTSETLWQSRPESMVDDFLLLLRGIFSRSLFRLMEQHPAFVRLAMSNNVVKDHLFDTYLKADASSEAGRACPAAVVAQIRTVQRPPRALPGPEEMPPPEE